MVVPYARLAQKGVAVLNAVGLPEVGAALVMIRPSAFEVGFGAQQKKDFVQLVLVMVPSVFEMGVVAQKKDSEQLVLVVVLPSVFAMGLVAQKKDSDLKHAVVNTVAELAHTAGPATAGPAGVDVPAIVVPSVFQVCNHYW